MSYIQAFLTSIILMAVMVTAHSEKYVPHTKHMGSDQTIHMPTCMCCDLGRSDCCPRSCIANQNTTSSTLGSLSEKSSLTKNLLLTERFPLTEGLLTPRVGCPFQLQPEDLPRELVELRRDFSRLDDMVKCSRAAEAVIPYRSNIWAWLVDKIKNPIGKKETSAIRKYVEACSKPSLLMYGSDLNEQEKRDLKNRLLLMVDSEEKVFCHGFRVGQYMVTAMHCLQNSSGRMIQDQWTVRTVASNKTYNATVVPLKNQNTDLEISPNLDYALLQINGFSKSVQDDIQWLGEVRKGERLIVVQSNVYVRIMERVEDSIDLSPTVTIENTPVCYAREVTSEGYVLHWCQTEWGSSGAPLLQRDSDGKLRLVAVHDAATTRIAALKECGAVAPNHGVKLPIEELKKAMQPM